MLPASKQVGFFSDAYCLEWTYAKAVLVRKQLARVLADKIEQSQFSLDEALKVAKTILFETPQQLLGMVPHFDYTESSRSSRIRSATSIFPSSFRTSSKSSRKIFSA